MTKLKTLFPPALLLSAALILTGCGGGSAPGPGAQPDTGIVGENGVKLSEIERYGETVSASEDGDLNPPGAVAGDIRRLLPQGFSAQRLGPARIPTASAGRPSAQSVRAQGLPGNAQTGKVALKILVLHAGTDDFGLAPARALLSQHGIVYDTLDAMTTDLNLGTLIGPDGVGKYSGVILASNALTTESSPGVFTSTLNDGEWATLFEYEAAYKVRQLALFGFPGIAPEDYGVRAVPGAQTGTSDATVTPGGKAVFGDLTAQAVPVRFSFAYPSRLEPVVGVTTTPLLTDANGNLLAVTSTAADGRERLLLTMAQNEYLTHTQLLGYGMVQWLTQGVYLGEYRRYLGVDIDDWFATGDRYDAPTKTVVLNGFRMKASDALSARDQQSAIRRDFPAAKNFTYAMVYNGLGADILAPRTCSPSAKVKDPLSAVSKCLGRDFDWVNHTRDHPLMDNLSLNESFNQVFQNTLIGLFMGLKLSENSLVTGELSGLGWKAPAEGQLQGGLRAGGQQRQFPERGHLQRRQVRGLQPQRCQPLGRVLPHLRRLPPFEAQHPADSALAQQRLLLLQHARRGGWQLQRGVCPRRHRAVLDQGPELRGIPGQGKRHRGATCAVGGRLAALHAPAQPQPVRPRQERVHRLGARRAGQVHRGQHVAGQYPGLGRSGGLRGPPHP